MDKKISFEAVVCYVAPAAIELEACSEGVLCASYGEAGAAGKELSEENVWEM